MGITTDNTSNNRLFVHLLTEWANDKLIFFNNDEYYFRYFAHVINLSVQNSLTYLNDDLRQVIFLFKFFK